MNFSSAERILDMIYKWNSKNPDNQIKIRGHVLVWHSQTPDWFFREDYKINGDLVDKETMNKRLEWYIATIAEHFNGPDSKYYGMFYAWDVVNEAISDSGGAYRSDKENSRWWEVYQSNEFIINAFRYANKYMPEDIDLFYNDYGDASLVNAVIDRFSVGVKAADRVKTVVDENACYDGAVLARPVLCGSAVERVAAGPDGEKGIDGDQRNGGGSEFHNRFLQLWFY